MIGDVFYSIISFICYQFSIILSIDVCLEKLVTQTNNAGNFSNLTS